MQLFDLKYWILLDFLTTNSNVTCGSCFFFNCLWCILLEVVNHTNIKGTVCMIQGQK